MSIVLNKYKVYCVTESSWEFIWNEKEPTTCPNDNTHEINSSFTTIIDTVTKSSVHIQEEYVPTGGHFAATTVSMNAIKNSTSSTTISWPYDVSVLSVEYFIQPENEKDIFNITIAENTVIGTITANVTSAVEWVDQNYTAGQMITYKHPIFGSRVYTCYLDTVSNEIPTNIGHWIHGLEIAVTDNVIKHVKTGYCIKLDDTVNINNCCRVISINSVNNKIYVEINLTNTFLASSPTMVKLTIHPLKDVLLRGHYSQNVGKTKIGATTLPKDTMITIRYENKSIDTDKIFVGLVEFLY